MEGYGDRSDTDGAGLRATAFCRLVGRTTNLAPKMTKSQRPRTWQGPTLPMGQRVVKYRRAYPNWPLGHCPLSDEQQGQCISPERTVSYQLHKTVDAYRRVVGLPMAGSGGAALPNALDLANSGPDS